MTPSWRCMLACLALFLTLTLTPAAGQGEYREGLPIRWNVNDYPNPYSVNQEQQRMCGRYNQSFVCDPNAIITSTQANDIDAEIKKVMAETPCHCFECQGKTLDKGYKIRVAIMSEMEPVLTPDDPEDRNEQLRDSRLYAYILSRRWQMSGYCNEGVLILYSRADNLVYTLTLPNARRRLSDSDITQITMITRSYFDQREKVADGIIQMIRRYGLCFNGRRVQAIQPGVLLT